VPVLTVAVAALLIAGVAGAVVVEQDDDRDTVAAGTATTAAAGASTTTTVASTPVTTPSELQALVAELQAFVSRERGLPFKAPVKTALLDDEAFEARLLADEDEDLQELEDITRVLKALHLLDGDIDLSEAFDDLLGAAVAGFYDSEKEELVVRGVKPTPFVRSVLVHELTHALQDQHFKLDRPELEDRDDEAAVAFSGVVEGDAVRIEQRYMRSLSPSDRRAAAREEADSYGDGIDDIPEVLTASLGFPYVFGPDFVDAVFDAGGQARLDAAFTSPPTTSEQLMHPQTYLSGQPVVSVAPPKADGAVIEQGAVGEFGLAMMFNFEDVDNANRAAAGWGGDWFVAWADGPRSCVRAEFVMDTPTDAAQLREALEEWADNFDGGITIEGVSPLTLTSCA
jgi:hypothetical protein